MTNKEVRATDEYLNAYAKYIKTGKDAECRALLTEAVEGVVPVPLLEVAPLQSRKSLRL